MPSDAVTPDILLSILRYNKNQTMCGRRKMTRWHAVVDWSVVCGYLVRSKGERELDVRLWQDVRVRLLHA